MLAEAESSHVEVDPFREKLLAEAESSHAHVDPFR